MKKSALNEWFYLLGFLVIGGAVFALYYFGAERFAASDSLLAGASRAQGETASPAPSDDRPARIVLPADEPRMIGRTRLVYRGLDDRGGIRLDVALLDLDPRKFYRYRVLPRRGDVVVTIAGRRYRLMDIGERRLRMAPLDAEPPGN